MGTTSIDLDEEAATGPRLLESDERRQQREVTHMSSDSRVVQSTIRGRFGGTDSALPMILLIAALVALAAWNRFMQDDAWISFRYSAHLLEGLGPVFNPGERVEGYTNFLWVLLMSIPMGLGFDPAPASQVLGLASFAATLGLLYTLTARMFESRPLALVCVFLVGTNYTFSSYATGGLETQLQTLLFMSVLWLCVDSWRAPLPTAAKSIALGTCVGLGLWARLDSVLLFAIPFSLLILKTARATEPLATKARRLAWLCLPPLVLVGGWLTWKLFYYGDVLPNTFHAKAGLPIPLERGLFYVFRFGMAYGLLPFLGLSLLSLLPLEPLRHSRARLGERAACTAVLMLWILYVVWAGGDFMEFRFFVPVIPLLYYLIVDGLSSFGRPTLVWLFAVVCTLFSAHHALTFWDDRGIESISKLEGHLLSPDEDWDGIGRALAQLFPEPSQIRIAVTASGALPYYSRLDSVDMLGLTDAWVARNGFVHGTRPGHQRIAPLGYLTRRDVHLVVGHPWMVPSSSERPGAFSVEQLRQMDIPIVPETHLPRNTRLIAIPVNPEYDVLVLYLTPHEEVESAIDRAGLRTYPVLTQ